MNEDPTNLEIYREEYKLVFDGCKFFVSIRFINVAFAMSIQSALITIYNQIVVGNRLSGLAISWVAELFLVAAIIIEWRTTSIYNSFIRLGNELELQLSLPSGLFHRIVKLSAVKGFRLLIRQSVGISPVYLGMILLWVILFLTTITKKTEPQPQRKRTNVTNTTQLQSSQ